MITIAITIFATLFVFGTILFVLECCCVDDNTINNIAIGLGWVWYLVLFFIARIIRIVLFFVYGGLLAIDSPAKMFIYTRNPIRYFYVFTKLFLELKRPKAKRRHKWFNHFWIYRSYYKKDFWSKIKSKTYDKAPVIYL